MSEKNHPRHRISAHLIQMGQLEMGGYHTAGIGLPLYGGGKGGEINVYSIVLPINQHHIPNFRTFRWKSLKVIGNICHSNSRIPPPPPQTCDDLRRSAIVFIFGENTTFLSCISPIPRCLNTMKGWNNRHFGN